MRWNKIIGLCMIAVFLAAAVFAADTVIPAREESEKVAEKADELLGKIDTVIKKINKLDIIPEKPPDKVEPDVAQPAPVVEEEEKGGMSGWTWAIIALVVVGGGGFAFWKKGKKGKEPETEEPTEVPERELKILKLEEGILKRKKERIEKLMELAAEVERVTDPADLLWGGNEEKLEEFYKNAHVLIKINAKLAEMFGKMDLLNHKDYGNSIKEYESITKTEEDLTNLKNHFEEFKHSMSNEERDEYTEELRKITNLKDINTEERKELIKKLEIVKDIHKELKYLNEIYVSQQGKLKQLEDDIDEILKKFSEPGKIPWDEILGRLNREYNNIRFINESFSVSFKGSLSEIAIYNRILKTTHINLQISELLKKYEDDRDEISNMKIQGLKIKIDKPNITETDVEIGIKGYDEDSMKDPFIVYGEDKALRVGSETISKDVFSMNDKKDMIIIPRNKLKYDKFYLRVRVMIGAEREKSNMIEVELPAPTTTPAPTPTPTPPPPTPAAPTPTPELTPPAEGEGRKGMKKPSWSLKIKGDADSHIIFYLIRQSDKFRFSDFKVSLEELEMLKDLVNNKIKTQIEDDTRTKKGAQKGAAKKHLKNIEEIEKIFEKNQIKEIVTILENPQAFLDKMGRESTTAHVYGENPEKIEEIMRSPQPEQKVFIDSCKEFWGNYKLFITDMEKVTKSLFSVLKKYWTIKHDKAAKGWLIKDINWNP